MTRKKLELCEVTDVNQTYCSNHFTGIICTHDKKKKKMELCEVTDVNLTYYSNHFTGITCTNHAHLG